MTDTTELYYAEMEAERNNAEIGYFNVRPQADTLANRALFRAGFERAFRILWNRLPASGEASVEEQARRTE